MAIIQRRRSILAGAAFIALIVALGIGQAVLQNQADAQGRTVQAPRFEVDPLWPKPLPNHWLLGMAIGVHVDDQDHVWIIHRSSATLHNHEKALETGLGECCRGAPPVLVFDQAGNLVRSWGGPGDSVGSSARSDSARGDSRSVSAASESTQRASPHPRAARIRRARSRRS